MPLTLSISASLDNIHAIKGEMHKCTLARLPIMF